MDRRKCPICGGPMPEWSVVPTSFSALAYYTREDGSGQIDGPCPGDESTIVCSKECLLILMDRRAEEVPKGKPVRVLVCVLTTEAPEVLKSFARQLRGIRDVWSHPGRL